MQLSSERQVAQIEEWRPIIHLGEYAAERYEVSNLGRVRSLDHRSNGKKYRGRILKPTRGRSACTVALCVGPSISGPYKVHSLALTTFVGPRPAGLECCHNDGNHANNRVDNLRWDTCSSNNRDKIRHGTNPFRNRERCPLRHLLKTPNLIRKPLAERGHRHCLSCGQTNTVNSMRRLRGRPTLDRQTESDRRYALIMADEAVR